jgi:uncharacterized protein
MTTFPLRMRPEAINPRHPNVVALLRGPLVLMAVKRAMHSPAPPVQREELLAATRISQRQWRVNSESGPIRMLPFTSLGGLPYSTYVNMS